MTHLFKAGKLLLHDLASSICFLAVFLATHNVALAVVLGMALGLAQIGWQLARKSAIEPMEYSN